VLYPHSCSYLYEKTKIFFSLLNVVVYVREGGANARIRLSRRFGSRWRYIVAQPQRLEIRFLGTRIRADGVVGIVGAVTLVGIILAMYIGN
jgi:hypothetical protein